MEKATVSPDDLVSALMEATEQLTEEVVEELEGGFEKIAKETVDEVKRLSPVYEGNVKELKKGDYRRKWKYKIEKEKGVTRVTVYNSKGGLTHLLENGHLIKNGAGRTIGKANPIPHIELAAKHAEEKLEKLMEEV